MSRSRIVAVAAFIGGGWLLWTVFLRRIPGTDPDRQAREQHVDEVSRAGQPRLSPNTGDLDAGSPVATREVAEAENLRVVVTDSWGRGLESATVHLLVDALSALTVRTDSRGWAQVWVPRDRDLTLLVEKEGFISGSRSLNVLPKSHTVGLTVRRAGVLTGVVRRRADGVAVADCWILGYPRYAPAPSFASVLYALEQWPSTTDEHFRLTKTDADGTFSMTELGPTEDWCLVAGAPGLMVPQVTRCTTRSSSPLELPIDYGYGAVLHLKDSTGKAPVLSNRLSPSHLNAECYSEEGGVSPSLPIPESALAGALAGLTVDPAALFPDALVQLFTCVRDETEVGPLHYKVSIPGYAQVDVSYAASPIRTGLEETKITLRPTCSRWGQLLLKFDKCPLAEGVEGVTALPQGALFLTNASHDVYTYPLRPEENRYLVTGVPEGSYELRFRSNKGEFEFPARGVPSSRIEIGEDVTECEIDLSSMGLCIFQVTGLDGERFRGYIEFLMAPGVPRVNDRGNPELTSGSMQVLPFPHIVTGLKSGQYTIWPRLPRMSNDGLCKQQWLLVEVAGGDSTVVKLQICQ